jgi:hypothetical protein
MIRRRRRRPWRMMNHLSERAIEMRGSLLAVPCKDGSYLYS